MSYKWVYALTVDELEDAASFQPPFMEASSEEITKVTDEEIRKLEHRIIQLKRYRNAHVPISRLPPEVLCRVFHWTSQDTAGGIRNVSHVSRFWRDVAINLPSLWIRPPLVNVHWTNEYLARSKKANLIVDISSQLHEYDVVCKFITLHMPRISHLNISWPLDTANSLFKVLPKSSSTLESFVCHTYPCYAGPEYLMPNGALCNAGRLRRLDLMGIVINWDLHLHRTLTTLKIDGIPKRRLPTITQFWDALERMPLLEILDLRHCLPAGDEVISRAETVNFPCLQELTLVCNITQAETMLLNTTFPPTTVIKADCRHRAGHINNASLTGLFSTIARSTNWGGKPIRTGEISFVLPGWLRFRAFATCLPTNSGDWGLLTDKILEFSLICEKCDMEKVLGDLSRELSLDGIVKLRIRNGGGTKKMSHETILKTYEKLPSLRTLITELDGHPSGNRVVNF